MIYLDNAATTPLKKEVLDKMLPYLTENYSNPSSFYSFSTNTKAEVEEARAKIAKALNAKTDEIYITSGGTESDNWALKGFAFANKDFRSASDSSAPAEAGFASREQLNKKGAPPQAVRLEGGKKHIVTSEIEHHAVLHSAKYLENFGFEVTYLKPDADGIISPEVLKSALRYDTILVSIMFTNNEIGTIEPIKELAEVAHNAGAKFHTDAVQAIGHIPIDVEDLGVDMLSLSAHKFGGPKGVGALYIKRGTKIHNFTHGGAQERNRRAGTENVAGVIGLAEAITMATKNIELERKRLIGLRDMMISKIEKEIPYCKLNGHREKRLPNNVNFSFKYIEGEGILIFLDMAGICASSGSACTSGSLDPSHVLLSIGLPHELAHGSVRFSLGEETTEQDIDYVVEKLKEAVARLRQMSPLYEGIE